VAVDRSPVRERGVDCTRHHTIFEQLEQWPAPRGRLKDTAAPRRALRSPQTIQKPLQHGQVLLMVYDSSIYDDSRKLPSRLLGVPFPSRQAEGCLPKDSMPSA